MKKHELILKEVIKEVNPKKEKIQEIEKLVDKFLNDFRKKIKKLGIDADFFVGGSFAKKTLVKKEFYDVDIFVRFNKKYKNEKLSELTKKILVGGKNIEEIHGSRTYYRKKVGKDIFIEIVPVKKIKIPKEAENTTDLSFMHVKYINKKVKSQKIIEDIKLAKKFCEANYFYGAESHIKGFSGYSIELLIIYYGSFIKFLKELSKIKKKEIIDIEKLYKNKKDVLLDLNSSKLESPIILIDPTYKHRNALAALGEKTFKEFQKTAKEFLKLPSKEFFEKKEKDFLTKKETAKKEKNEFILIEAKCDKIKEDISKSKLLKFFNYFAKEIERYFEIKEKDIKYVNENSAQFYFTLKNKGEKLVIGPELKDEKHVKEFKKKHKKTFIKNKRVCSKEKFSGKIDDFVENWLKKNKKVLNEMYIHDLKIIY